MIDRPIVLSGKDFSDKGKSMKLWRKMRYRWLCAIEITLVHLVIAGLLGCALFDTVLPRRQSQRSRDIAKV